MYLLCVVLARSVLASQCVIRGRRPAWHFFMCVCVLFFLLNSAGGGKAMPGLYALQSLVSIIEEWYLQRWAGEEGGGTAEGRRWRRKMEGKKITMKLCFDELLPYL